MQRKTRSSGEPHMLPGKRANKGKFGKLGRTCRESVFSNDLEASAWARGPSKTAMDEVDMSVFSKMAELLARPLSPTAMEKEAKEEAAASRRAPKPRMAKARSGLQNRSGSALEPVRRSPVVSSDIDTEANGSILSAVSELSGLQQVWKEKAKHPSYRKAGPPRMKRPPVKVLAEEERLQKMDEIDNLEQQLTEAKKMAAATREAAAAAERLAHAAEADEEQDSGSEKRTAPELLGSAGPEAAQKDGLHRQAEERVKARRKQEAKERRERSRREAEEKRKKQADAEAKASELERQAKERVQERIRAERSRERLLQEQQERDAEEREKRSRQVAEELRQQALKRLADKDQASRQLAEEMAKQESEARRLQIEESEARAEELRMKTRQRMHQHLREQKEQENAAEEARQRRMEDAARAEEGKIRQALQSQHRAQLRAAEFKHKARSEEQARMLLHEEEMERQQEHAESALMERQRKRRWRANLGSKSLTPQSQSTASRASSQPPLRPLQSQDSPAHAQGGGCSAESSRANTPSCPTWAVVDSDAVQAPARPRPHAVHSRAVPQLTKLPRAASQPVRQRPPAALPLQGSRDSSRATSPRCPEWHIGDADENPPALEEEVPSMSPRTLAGLCETPALPENTQSVPKPWKQKAIQVNSASYYLEALKAARGGRGTPSAAGRPAPGSRGYAEQMRLRAEDVEAKQREEHDTKMERGYAALQRVQQRGMQASPVRSSMA
eukprot:s4275_g5.t1